jgi:MFS family permease
MGALAKLSNVRSRSIGRDFRKVWMSVLISSTGDGMFITALPLFAAVLTRDPVLIAGLTVAQRLPWLLLSMVTGAVADRMDRRRLLIGADLVRLGIVALLGLAIVVDAANIWWLYVCAFLLGVGETLHVNAAQALVPAIVEPADLLQANARFGTAQIASAQFIGPPLGTVGFAVAQSVPFLADAVSFAASAVLVSSLPDVHGVESPTTRMRDDVREGFAFMWRNLALRRMTLLLTVINFFYFAATALLVLYTKQHLHAGDVVYTAMFVGAATGTVLIRFVVSRITARLGVVGTLSLAVWLWAAAIVGLASTDVPMLGVLAYSTLGLGTGLWWAVNTTVRQQITPTRMLGRMNAAFRTVSWGVVPFGAAFGGVLARHFGLLAPFVVAGVVMVLVALSSRRVLRPVDAALREVGNPSLR